MPLVIPIEVQVPPTYNERAEFLKERVSRYAQALIEEDALRNRPHRKMTLAEAENNSISVDESEHRLTELIQHHYQA